MPEYDLKTQIMMDYIFEKIVSLTIVADEDDLLCPVITLACTNVHDKFSISDVDYVDDHYSDSNLEY